MQQRARRLASLAGLALVGTLALTGCRSQPGAAIYVGSMKYTESYVDGLADQLKKVSPPTSTRGDRLQTITEWIVKRDLGKRIVADRHWPAPEVDEESATAEIQDALRAAKQTGPQAVESVRPLIKLYAEYSAYTGVVQQHATPVQLTDADYADLYQKYNAAGLLQPDVDLATFRVGLPQQQEWQLIQLNMAMRGLYGEAIRKVDVTINPKYGFADGLPVLETNGHRGIVVLPLNRQAGQPAVVPAPVEQPQGPANG